ncbi:MAG TPA: DUF4339 domain-containing protein [Chitinophagales bacterium]|nr:DUF4339 domain-containing protein [Chitinophagales bacterium]
MKYYLRTEAGQFGPFTFDELKEKGITKDTLVWYEGLHEWTKANEILELVDLVTDSTPPGGKTIAQLLAELRHESQWFVKSEKGPIWDVG